MTRRYKQIMKLHNSRLKLASPNRKRWEIFLTILGFWRYQMTKKIKYLQNFQIGQYPEISYPLPCSQPAHCNGKKLDICTKINFNRETVEMKVLKVS